VAELKARGGLLSASDLAGYTVREREPLVQGWRHWTLITMPPPSSGGLVMLQVLGVLEAWPALGPELYEPAGLHRSVEAFKHGFADRARWMGDPDQVEVPVQRLLSEERMAAVRAALSAAGPGQDGASCSVLPAAEYGLPLDPGQDAGTHHISVIDGSGVAVALTTTINGTFGSGVVDAGSGLLLNDEMDDFVAAPGVPNQYGLVGNERNAVQPGRRPLSSMSPTIALDGSGQPVLVVGASGGPRIITGTVHVLRAVLEGGVEPAQAVASPRLHHQWMPDLLRTDADFPDVALAALRRCGHQLGGGPPGSAVQVAMRRPDGQLVGACDPRKGGAPAIVEAGAP